MTPELAHALLFWGAVPVLWVSIHWRDARGFLIAAVFGVFAVFHAWGDAGALWDLAFHGGTLGLAALVPFYFRRYQSGLEREFARRKSHLSEQRSKSAHRHDAIVREKNELQDNLERLQNRFALVQVMATKLEAGEILQTLGHMWKKRTGVKGCLILRRQLNGNWSTAFTDGIFNAQDWIRFMTAHPSIARSRRIRRYAANGRQLSFPGQPFGSTCLLIPFTWDKDILAMGVVEVEPQRMEDSLEGFNIERKLVSIGLRRADLYDLMTERSRYDALTGAFLRRSLTERLEDALRKSHRYNTPLFFALMDIDHFKTLNDRWGHVIGDRVLVHLAQMVRRLAHPGVTLGRFGGDEFALIMEMDSQVEVFAWFERLRQLTAESPLRDREALIRFTISAGVSAYLPGRPALSDLMAQADHALYQAKRAGRDRVVAWRAPGSTSSSTAPVKG
ncbi:MAG TPA: GGDEF domain-containing protein [Elusimicrobiota bacterium]|nr:GGDEF domain-containing protein [Elusimicrobiota bacterium]HNI57385.1 GGDEF domain-containing protein [Elusimicrobiota bacterium]